LLRAWDNGHIQGRIESWHNASFAYRFEYRYPLLDRRIVEFALSLPGEYFYSSGIGRYIFKKTNKDILPSHYIKMDFKKEYNRINKLIDIYNKVISSYIERNPNNYICDKILSIEKNHYFRLIIEEKIPTDYCKKSSCKI
jgi:asparagine synthetase B (glutamine-hydrolysing)